MWPYVRHVPYGARVPASCVPCTARTAYRGTTGQGFGQFYRFAAMEVCPPARKPFAVTLVLSGGVLAAFAGPQLSVSNM